MAQTSSNDQAFYPQTSCNHKLYSFVYLSNIQHSWMERRNKVLSVISNLDIRLSRALAEIRTQIQRKDQLQLLLVQQFYRIVHQGLKTPQKY